MSKDMSLINVDVDNEILKVATEILNNIGLTLEDGVNLFLEEVIDKGKIPFEFDEFIYNKNKYPSYSNREELKKSLLSND